MKNKNNFSAVAMIIIALVILFGGVTVILTGKETGLNGMESITSTSAARVSKGQLESLPAPDPHFQKNGMAAITGVRDISPKPDTKADIQNREINKNNDIAAHQYIIS